MCGKSYQNAEKLFVKRAKKELKVESVLLEEETKAIELCTQDVLYTEPFEEKKRLIGEIDLFLNTLKRHSAEDFNLRDIYRF